VGLFPFIQAVLASQIPDGDSELLQAIQTWAAGEGLKIASIEFGMWSHGLVQWSPVRRPRAYRVSLEAANGSVRLADVRRANFSLDRFAAEGKTIGLTFHWFD
jgi:hypothetical protein